NYRKKLYFANPYTSDPVRFQDEHRAIARNPALALGGPTCGWAAAAFDSINRLQAPGFAEAVHTPVLMIAGRKDRVVRLDALKAISRRLPLSRLLVIENARHEILKETDAVRKRFWEAFDGFLRKG
ncbi:MAG: alpha/beta hydrolase, partial [Desulfobacterales bacterium]|nr:alpha/beta hydrolase [Desulfobacterales bacterium]